MLRLSLHARAVCQALFVTLLWSTSWVIIKLGLKDIPALTFAGLRYTLALACLLPFAWQPAQRDSLRRLSARGWLWLIVLGLLFYAVTQGALFVGLSYLPAVSVSLMLNFTTIVVALLGMALLKERPARLQWLGTGVNLAGILIYFYPVALPVDQVTGLIVVAIGVLANAVSSILGRRVNRAADASPLAVTTVSMGVGSLTLLAGGLAAQGLPPLTPLNWLFVAWLAVVNTAFAFTLWNHTLRTLAAMESSIINSTMLAQIAILAWVFLGEQLTLQEIVGMGLAGAGALLVQVRRATGASRNGIRPSRS